ncbi:MAG: thioredoxin domain-containing protein, partial [Chitinophagaceae bacterium]|nr:thioredoxin domain-containing protein [Chitinophagaceae bacterium]
MSTYTNRLAKETSPYLLQHAHNPVDWYPWGEEALAKAKSEQKPILVSIGYAACHWCHVMEKESFEDVATAELMNELFVNIKIDREERPDLDHIYMDAVQAMSGSGGWPLNVFLTPETKPFFGGTYFPPVRAFNRSSWKEVLSGVAEAYRERRTEVEEQADQLTNHLIQANGFGLQAGGIVSFSVDAAKETYQNLMKNADKVNGGFGKAPKFPQTFSIRFLLHHFYYTDNQDALTQACLSLDKMIYGGIYDQIGGGFARYSTDDEWLAPHFEKMLYDNALILDALCEAYQATGNELYKKIIRQTAAFMEREWLSPEGGFYSALDADSEGEEGKFYVWSKEEVKQVLGEDADLFCEFFDISERGNWEHKNILRINVPIQPFALLKGRKVEEVNAILERGAVLLMNQRSTRVRPQLDDKILLSWNALAVGSYCRMFAALGDEVFLERAVKTMEFLLNQFRAGHMFCHTYKNGEARQPAFLDDYAYLIQSLILLQEVSSDAGYLQTARELTELVIREFGEEETGFFFYTHANQQDVILRKKEIYDGAVPSG